MLCSGVSNEGLCQISKPDSSRNQRNKNSKKLKFSMSMSSLASHTLLAKNKAEGSGDRAYNVSFHSPCIGGETYFMCTCYMWMSQVVVRVVEPAMERVPEIVMVAIVCQSLNPSQKQVHMRYVSPPIHGEWNETLYARSPDPSALFFARRVWLARLVYVVVVVVVVPYEPG